MSCHRRVCHPKQFFPSLTAKKLTGAASTPSLSPFRSIGGKPPELIVFGPAGEEVERVNVEGKSVDDIKEMLLTYGFSEKADGKAEL